jgi:hypothetical protein
MNVLAEIYLEFFFGKKLPLLGEARQIGFLSRLSVGLSLETADAVLRIRKLRSVVAELIRRCGASQEK